MPRGRKPVPVAERFWTKVMKTDGCWNWTACTNGNGYGTISVLGKPALAHRVSYEISYGPIPEGLVVDHLCRNTMCVRPDHLEAVPTAENNRRGLKGALRPGRTHCKWGHELTEENTYTTKSGYDSCKTCTNAGHKAAYQVTKLHTEK